MDSPLFNTILIPYDGSEQAALALSCAARLPSRAMRLVRVEPNFQVLAPGPLANFRPDWRAIRTEQVEEELAATAERLRGEGREVEVVVRFGDPAEEIIAVAEGADLIVMTTQGRGTAGRALFGSVADRVARHAPVPTLLVRATAATVASPQPARVVVPLDGSPLAESAVPLATRLATQLALPLHIVRVVDLDEILQEIWRGREEPGEALPTDDAYDEARRHCEEVATTYLERIAAPLRADGLAVRSAVRTGTPAFILLDEARPDDLLVMTTHGYGGVRRWMLGSVADKLVREAAAPVLLVRGAADTS